MIGVLLALVVWVPGILFAQSSTQKLGSPKDILQQFVKLDLDGQRLTDQGWYESAHFFVEPSTPPLDKKILIVSSAFELREDEHTKDQEKLSVFFLHFYGELDPNLRFHAAPIRSTNGALVKDGMLSLYTLGRSEKRVEFDPETHKREELVGPAQWRIENRQVGTAISLTTAVRYITEQRDKSSDPAVKKNGDATLSELKKLK